jgi:hypothetical protein
MQPVQLSHNLSNEIALFLLQVEFLSPSRSVGGPVEMSSAKGSRITPPVDLKEIVQ